MELDYEFCEEIIKTHSKSFYFAFSKLPKEKAQAVYAIYAFCRQADDSIDQATSQQEQKQALDQLKNQLDLFQAEELR